MKSSKFSATFVFLSAVISGWITIPLQAGRQQVSQPDPIQIDVAVVSPINDIEVPARLKGFIDKLEVDEGDDIALGDVLAILDPASIDSELKAAQIRAANAERQASDSTPVKYAEATLGVAINELETGEELFRKNATPSQELERLRLSKIQAELQVDRSNAQMAIDKGAVDLENQNVASVNQLLNRHTIVAPFAGQIIKVNRRAGEYIQEGETLLRLADLANVKVEGNISSSRVNPDQLKGKPLIVRLKLANDEIVTFEGHVKSIGLNNREQNTYLVQAVIANQKRGNEWLLRPNSTVEMEVLMSDQP